MVAQAEDVRANTVAAEEESAYVETTLLEDFQVHFLVSLPFTALYSYVAISSLDALVQGTFSTELREADIWVMIGLAVGGSLAVALGSAGRVPDQSRPRVEPVPDAGNESRAPAVSRMQIVRILF